MIALKSAQRLPRGLSVEWMDGMRAQFTNVWLRDNSLHMRPALVHLDLNPCPQKVMISQNSVSVEWPPFLQANFPSEFLRSHSRVQPGTNLCKNPNKMILNKPWRIQQRPLSDDHRHIGAMIWKDPLVINGTVWPHLQKIPSVVTVESRFNGARISLVDAITALKRLAEEHPEHFRFMLENPIEYQHAFFKASHQLANIDKNVIISGVFNNDYRSSQMTTENLDSFYRSLKSFYNICCEEQQEVYINSDELLVVDNSQMLIGAPAQAGREMRVRIYA
ncbi:hypothetical protein OESDEN_03518 [Oesophagostomum dentatum]|uniref:Uncharacterized protein n=1 Tax=Oesophagostomum dentatum TaxID=61180 RepID=A0A0B1TGY4_OESDE|nr:hypothetical protein OESDEN_03518 [Oesophagostomum dentatum]